MNQLIRRLERVEGDLLAERHARVDDLALLVDLVSCGWRGVEQRLARIESARHRRRCGRLPHRPASPSYLLTAGQHEHEAAPPPRLALEIDPAAERDRELARDREAEPGAAAVARPERTEDPLALLLVMPGPVSATATATAPFSADSSTRRAPRRASTGTRSRAS